MLDELLCIGEFKDQNKLEDGYVVDYYNQFVEIIKFHLQRILF